MQYVVICQNVANDLSKIEGRIDDPIWSVFGPYNYKDDAVRIAEYEDSRCEHKHYVLLCYR